MSTRNKELFEKISRVPNMEKFLVFLVSFSVFQMIIVSVRGVSVSGFTSNLPVLGEVYFVSIGSGIMIYIVGYLFCLMVRDFTGLKTPSE